MNSYRRTYDQRERPGAHLQALHAAETLLNSEDIASTDRGDAKDPRSSEERPPVFSKLGLPLALLFLLLLAGCPGDGTGSGSAEDPIGESSANLRNLAAPPPRPTLSQRDATKWGRFLKSTEVEDRWKDAGWRTSIWDAIVEADRTQRPLLLYSMNGHPMGFT